MPDMHKITFRALVFFSFFLPVSVAASEPLATATPYEPPIARLIIGLLLCVFLAYAVIHVLRNAQRGKGLVRNLSALKFNHAETGVNQVSVLETHRLNATSDVCLISWKQQEFLVIIGQHEPKILNGSNSCENTPAVSEEER